MRKYITITLALLIILISVTPTTTAQDHPKAQLTIDQPAPPTLDPDTRDLLERIVAAEARGESLEGMMAVCQVIRDRSELWGMTYAEVVTARGQFCRPYSGEISEAVSEAVERVFVGGERVFEGPVTHFASNVPYWAAGKELVGEIGNHKFYY